MSWRLMMLEAHCHYPSGSEFENVACCKKCPGTIDLHCFVHPDNVKGDFCEFFGLAKSASTVAVTGTSGDVLEFSCFTINEEQSHEEWCQKWEKAISDEPEKP